jgi:hypothetical protein
MSCRCRGQRIPDLGDVFSTVLRIKPALLSYNEPKGSDRPDQRMTLLESDIFTPSRKVMTGRQLAACRFLAI